MRTDQYKLILYPKVKRMQLFDIVKDPWEMKDLSSDPANAAMISELFRELTKWQATISDKLVLNPASFDIKA